MRWFRSDHCQEMTGEFDGKWRCGKKAGHLGVHQGFKGGVWYSVWWGEDAELDRHFGIPHDSY